MNFITLSNSSFNVRFELLILLEYVGNFLYFIFLLFKSLLLVINVLFDCDIIILWLLFLFFSLALCLNLLNCLINNLLLSLDQTLIFNPNCNFLSSFLHFSNCFFLDVSILLPIHLNFGLGESNLCRLLNNWRQRLCFLSFWLFLRLLLFSAKQLLHHHGL